MRFSKVSMPPLFHKYEFYPINSIDFTFFSLTCLYEIRPVSYTHLAAGIGVAKIAFLHVGEDGSLAFSELFSIINWKAIVLSLAIWYGLVKWKKHPILYIVVAAVAGIVFQFH